MAAGGGTGTTAAECGMIAGVECCCDTRSMAECTAGDDSSARWAAGGAMAIGGTKDDCIGWTDC